MASKQYRTLFGMIVFPTRLIKLSAWALILAGVLVTFVNLIFTPQILAIEDFAQSAASMAWAWRLGLASLTGILLVISAFGILALFEKKQPGTLRGLLLFVILIIGNILLVAHEWNQWLFVRDLAIHFPETLNQLEDLESFSLFDLSAAIGTLGFFLSWLIT
ncbi:MAG: hypothetical protein KJO25_00390, partial [Bacteroidia bacterium]|nr:hypothetical protein [Bacteroidia bacterium]